MLSSSSSLADYLSDGVYNDKCVDCRSCFDHMLIKEDKLILGVL